MADIKCQRFFNGRLEGDGTALTLGFHCICVYSSLKRENVSSFFWVDEGIETENR